MSIPYLFILTTILSAWTAMIINIHSHAEAWQRTQIALDNAATVIGQMDKVLFNKIQFYNATTRLAEIGHHSVHWCKDIPYLSAYCKPADEGLEFSINTARYVRLTSSRIDWYRNLAAGLREMGKLDSIPISIERESSLPVHTEKCNYCGLETFIEIDDGKAPVKTLIKSIPKTKIEIVKVKEEEGNFPVLVLSAESEVGGKSLKSTSDWKYKLKTGVKSDYE